ncbi:MAG: hypothetical protein M0C28_27000 [Candidatus Moduliflexus flocculans]|nr:hypothetical protein [Candidatus Moduliflexus flocculans]
MVEKKASDLHLIAGLHPAFRVHGDLLPLDGRRPVHARQPQGVRLRGA